MTGHGFSQHDGMNTSSPITFDLMNPKQHGRILFAMGMSVSEIAKQIEEKMTYPGQIRVTVIREKRAVGIAK